MAYNPGDKNKKQNTGQGPERNLEGKGREQGNLQGQRGQANPGQQRPGGPQGNAGQQRPGGPQGNVGQQRQGQSGGSPQKARPSTMEEEDE